MAWEKPPFIKNGVKVMVRPDNSEKAWRESSRKHEYYDAGYVPGSMDKYRGQIVTIAYARTETCQIEGNGYNWSYASFLPPSKQELNTMLLNGEISIDTYREMINNI